VIPLGFSMLGVHKFKPDIIHTHTPFGVGWEAIYAATILGVPAVGTHHTFYDHYLRHVYLDYEVSKKMSWYYTVAYYNRCDLVMCPSRSLADVLEANELSSKVEVVPNCVDTDLFVSPDSRDEKLNLVYMGRLSYEKNIAVVIDAFKIILSHYPATTLTLIGDGPEKFALERQAVLLGIESKMNFSGMLRGVDLVKALQMGDIFMTASASENLPLSIIEAMATGMPVVGVDSLGIPEIVRDGENGFLVPPDDAEAMAHSTLKLLLDVNLRRKMSLIAHETAQNFSRSKIAERLEKHYLDTINAKK
jgi:1,2-diacylglycerol 3-alpha-glucosyltransferase